MVASPTADAGAWRLDGPLATLRRPALHATLDLRRPARGLAALRVGATNVPAAGILGVCPAESPPEGLGPLQDAYVRGCDLVITYGPSERRPVRTQVYWRVLPPAAPSVVALVELVVSVQTHLLDSRPRLNVVSSLESCELLALDCAGQQSKAVREDSSEAPYREERVLLARPVDGELSYVQMVHPTDWNGASLRRDEPGSRLVHHLFGERLEKGVIRRARVQGALVLREGDRDTAAECRRRLQFESPPLTT